MVYERVTDAMGARQRRHEDARRVSVPLSGEEPEIQHMTVQTWGEELEPVPYLIQSEEEEDWTRDYMELVNEEADAIGRACAQLSEKLNELWDRLDLDSMTDEERDGTYAYIGDLERIAEEIHNHAFTLRAK